MRFLCDSDAESTCAVGQNASQRWWPRLRHSTDRDSRARISIYKQLPAGPYIRVLHLHPGEHNDPIQGSLEVISLEDQSRKYDTLSYEWGPTEPLQPVTINGTELLIRSNLHTFLRIVRHQQQPVCVWADAICINQTSNPEKAHQVQQMWTVYSQAATTHVFVNSHVNCPELWDWRWANLSTARPLEARQALSDVLQASYWTRLWIIQEIIASRVITVHVSETQHLSWRDWVEQCWRVSDLLCKICPGQKSSDLRHDLKDTLIQLDEHNGADEDRLQAALTPPKHSTLAQQRPPPRERRWKEVVHSYCNKQCSDPRDRVYGLNGFVWSKIPVDYEASAFSIFANVMRLEWNESYYAEFVADFAEVLWKALRLESLPSFYATEYRAAASIVFSVRARSWSRVEDLPRKTGWKFFDARAKAIDTIESSERLHSIESSSTLVADHVRECILLIIPSSNAVGARKLRRPCLCINDSDMPRLTRKKLNLCFKAVCAAVADTQVVDEQYDNVKRYGNDAARADGSSQCTIELSLLSYAYLRQLVDLTSKTEDQSA